MIAHWKDYHPRLGFCCNTLQVLSSLNHRHFKCSYFYWLEYCTLQKTSHSKSCLVLLLWTWDSHRTMLSSGRKSVWRYWLSSLLLYKVLIKAFCNCVNETCESENGWLNESHPWEMICLWSLGEYALAGSSCCSLNPLYLTLRRLSLPPQWSSIRSLKVMHTISRPHGLKRATLCVLCE